MAGEFQKQPINVYIIFYENLIVDMNLKNPIYFYAKMFKISKIK